MSFGNGTYVPPGEAPADTRMHSRTLPMLDNSLSHNSHRSDNSHLERSSLPAPAQPLCTNASTHEHGNFAPLCTPGKEMDADMIGRLDSRMLDFSSSGVQPRATFPSSSAQEQYHVPTGRRNSLSSANAFPSQNSYQRLGGPESALPNRSLSESAFQPPEATRHTLQNTQPTNVFQSNTVLPPANDLQHTYDTQAINTSQPPTHISSDVAPSIEGHKDAERRLVRRLRTLWFQDKGDPTQVIELPDTFFIESRPTPHLYICGHPSGSQFHSANEFYPHFKRMISKMNGWPCTKECDCRLCTKYGYPPAAELKPTDQISTDGDPGHWPRDETGWVKTSTAAIDSFVEQLKDLWRQERGSQDQVITIPAGYVLLRLTGRGATRLYGHPATAEDSFRSPMEFYPHFKHLISITHGDRGHHCSCRLCRR